MRVVCAWCKATIRSDAEIQMLTGPPPSNVDEPVSHGICPACYTTQEKVLASMGPDHSTVTDADVGGEA